MNGPPDEEVDLWVNVEAALIHLPILIMHGVHLRMIVKTK